MNAFALCFVLLYSYRLVPGIAESSYGTQVAALAGVPTEICDRASSVSREFLASSKEIQAQRSQSRIPMASLSDFAYLFKLGAGAQGGALPDDEEDAKTICSQLDVIRAQVKALAGAGAENAPVAEAVDVAVAVDVGTTASCT